MASIGGSKLASDLVGGMRAQVAKAMDEVRLDIAAATTELLTEIKDGAKVARAIRAEAMEVRAQWGEVIGNAEAAADESMAAVQAVIQPK